MRYFVIIGLLIGVALTLYSEYSAFGKFDKSSIVWTITSGLACMFLGLVLYLFSGSLLLSIVNTEPTVQVDANIIALQDNYTVSGRRCLTHGYINEKLSYAYMHKQSDDGMKMYTVPANKSTVYYIEDDETPHIQYISEWYTNETLRKLYPIDSFCGTTYYKIFVPHGTIVEDYVLDLR